MNRLSRIGLMALTLVASSLFAQAVAPKVRFKIEAEYTKAALKAKIQGLVTLVLTVGVDGIPRDIRVVRSLDAGLDANAVLAVKQWIFWPATVDGKPVEHQSGIDVSFKLRRR